MSIQEIAVSNNTKKRLIRAIQDESILLQDDNGDVIINVAAYQQHKASANNETLSLEDIVGDITLNYDSEFFLFS